MKTNHKILIIGQPFTNNSGGGITLTNLFSGWEKDKIAVACSPWLLSNNIDTSLCDTYYQLGHKEHKWIFPFNLMAHKYFSGIVKIYDAIINNKTSSRSNLRVRIIMDYFYPLLRYIGLYHGLSRTELSNDFCNWVNDFKPDIIYAQAAFRHDVQFCVHVHNYLKKPLIFHMMDDWPSLIGNRGLFKKYWHKKIDNEFRILLGKATLLLSISDSMSQEYKKRYGKDFHVFHNSIDIEFWKKHQRIDYTMGNSPTILYAGRTGLGINASLENIAKAVQYLNKELNLGIKLKLQIAENLSWIDNYSCIECNSFVSYKDLPKVFSEADFLILPYDFSEESIKFVQYSMPTKAPEYMISGTPIIIFAPEATAIVKYAKEYQWAKLVTTNNVNELAKVIMELLKNKEERQEIGQNAIRIAEERHNSIKVTNDFRNLLCLQDQ